MYTAIKQNLHILDKYPVEDFHILLRARTEPWDNAENIQRKAVWIDQRRQQLHDFRRLYNVCPSKAMRAKAKQLRYLKLCAAHYLLELINNICTHFFLEKWSSHTRPKLQNHTLEAARSIW